MREIMESIFSFQSDSPLLFTQFYFWVFFAIVYTLFAMIMELGTKHGLVSRGRMHLRNVFLLVVSLFFYYKTSGLFLALLCFVIVSDWLIAQWIACANCKNHTASAKIALCLSVVIDLGLLCYFKYAYFFTNMVNDLFGTQWEVFDYFAYIGNEVFGAGSFSVDSIILPVGISFFIFQVISYTSDVYHQRIQPVSNILDFGFYVSFFPQLVAGPIVRAEEFVPQLYRPFHLSKHQAGLAVFWILNGLAKKIILSDYLAVNFIDRVFDHPLLFSGFENLFALFAYSLQVYADFSGYTDVAIGVALLLGFYLPKNFDSPYKSKNPQEFWRRWHMSLSRWLKTYLYIPLGGNRNATFGTWFWVVCIAMIATILSGSWIVAVVILALAGVLAIIAWRIPSHRQLLFTNLNSFITMILGGLWHGASWNFVLWGGLNGLGMIIYKLWNIMHWHLRMLLVGTITVGLWFLRDATGLPVVNVLSVCALIMCVCTLIRYIYALCEQNGKILSHAVDSYHEKIMTWFSNAWAIAQTFTFITFTRLFFRSSSNLDPASANQVAWETAKDMMNQIGGAWNSSIIPEFIFQYRHVVVLFVIGMIIHWLPERFKRWYRLTFCMLPWWMIVGISLLVIAGIYQFVTADMQPFIYFQF